ncbi:MAG TPA: hypothetical protein VFE37_16680 [Chloroflexota bacterium]|nr:hypothetical protein [Chloroflexota bacterium]
MQAPERRRRRAFLLVVVLLVPVLLMGGGALVVGALLADVRAAYLRAIVDAGKEPAFLLTLAFLATFGIVRLITYSIRHQRLPFFHNVTTRSGLHIHHMVPGMVLVLLSGYLGLVLVARRPVDLLAIVFGIGAALVLDEFALWLRLADVYWQPQGRESIDAVVLAGGIAILYLLGLDFWPHLIEALLRSLLAPR